MSKHLKPKVVCVDDDPAILEGLTYTLRFAFEVVTFTNPKLAIAYLETEENAAVVLSDMRMPEMNGAEFLARAHEIRPDMTRLLLTGQADLDSAISAINDGHIYRFLTKPCAPAVVAKAVSDAAELHRLINAEKDLLEQTVNGCIKALVQALALTNPFSFGRAITVHNLSSELAERVGVDMDWRLEAATLLSLIGYIILPADVAEKVYKGKPLTPREQQMADRVPEVTESLVAKIPRMNEVSEIIGFARRPYIPVDPGHHVPQLRELSMMGDILHVALDFDRFISLGMPGYRAAGALQRNEKLYNPVVLEALQTLKCGSGMARKVLELSVGQLRETMVLASDLVTTSGTLLVPVGQELTTYAIERIRNLPPGSIREPACVYAEESAAA